MNSEFVRQARILIVDDELANVRLLEKLLKRAGYENLFATIDSRQVVPLFTKHPPALVLLALNMPHLDGYEVLALLGDLAPPASFLPIIVLTGDPTPAAKRRALANGATDFLCKPFDNEEVILRIKNALRTRVLHLQLQNQNALLEERVSERTEELQKALAELRTTQERIVQRERLHALGMMATGVAHDFNNVLSLILGYSELLLNDQGDTKKTTRYLQTVISAAQDAARIVNRLAQFQRPRSESDLHQPIQLPVLVKQAVAMTKPKWKDQAMARSVDIDIVLQLGKVPNVAGDPAELREMLTNLIFNAVDAMPDGGKIIISTRNDDDSVLLEIADTGSGMPEEIRQRCLEPFFTTKGEHGSGLGLAMIYGIVQRHRGSLDIKTEVDVGTTFEIRLPVHASLQKRVTHVTDRLIEPLQILVVDDQPVLCEILTEYLKGDCHSVTTAQTGKEAVEKFRQNGFDLVITDKAMPGMTGDELATALRSIRPDIPIMLLTGFGEENSDFTNSADIDLVIGKPVNLAILRQAIAKLMTSLPCKTIRSNNEEIDIEA